MTQPAVPQAVILAATDLKAEFATAAAKHGRQGLLLRIWRKVGEFTGESALKAEQYRKYVTEMQAALDELSAGDAGKAQGRLGALRDVVQADSLTERDECIDEPGIYPTRIDKKEQKRKQVYAVRIDDIGKMLTPEKMAETVQQEIADAISQATVLKEPLAVKKPMHFRKKR